MSPREINDFLDAWSPKRERTIVIIDYANVDHWKDNLRWTIGIRELAALTKKFSSVKELRRFYYGSDFGPHTSSTTLEHWSEMILDGARYNNLTVVTKRVKYIHDSGREIKKANLDVEMTLDLIKMRRSYDHIILFSGDGDMAYALKYVVDTYQKTACVFGARDSVGSELTDALTAGDIDHMLWAEDFESRLNIARFRGR